ncbi:MAG TPA: LPS export ABC transporter periplasmic protein LptC [Bacteroidales bacterium]|nr:LPS export ABC transporter periplasmic protein LptC [Bacteroidales bacterium]HQH14626.1 LPS export ABC transporter periplasmic protein LptC [Bacteroidales bacterium]
MSAKPNKYYLRTLTKTIALIISIGVTTYSCKNDMKTITSLTLEENIPLETAKNIEVVYSDSGKIILKIVSPLLNRYIKEDHYLEFPEGLTLYFYDSMMNVKATLTANYGVSWEETNIMEVKDDVVINNYDKQEVLNTEHIIWNRKEQKIFSNVFVKRTSPDGVLYGDGFDANESLTNYTLRNPHGVFTIQDNEPE